MSPVVDWPLLKSLFLFDCFFMACLPTILVIFQLLPFSSDQLLGNSREHTAVHGPLRDRKQAVKLYFLFTTIPQIFPPYHRALQPVSGLARPWPGLTLRAARCSPPAASRQLGASPPPPPFKLGQSAGGRARGTGIACGRRRWRREGGRPECDA